jgi:hypothetical protein
MSFDIFNGSNYDNGSDEKSLADTLKPEAKAARRDVVSRWVELNIR